MTSQCLSKVLTHAQLGDIGRGGFQKEGINSIGFQAPCRDWQHHYLPSCIVVHCVVVRAAGLELGKLAVAGRGDCVAGGVQQQTPHQVVA